MRGELKVADIDPAYIEALTNLANLDLEDMRENKPDALTDLLYFFERNPPTPFDLLTTLLYFFKIRKYSSSSSSSSSPSFKENKVSPGSVGDSFTKIVDVYSSKLGRPTIDFLNIHRVSTLRELCNITKSRDSSMWVLLRQLQDMELLVEYGQVGKQYYRGHRPPTMFGLRDATEADRVDSQRRYAILTLGYDPRTLNGVVIAQNDVNWTKDPTTTIYNKYKDTNWTPRQLGDSLRELGYKNDRLSTAMAETLKMLREHTPENTRGTK